MKKVLILLFATLFYNCSKENLKEDFFIHSDFCHFKFQILSLPDSTIKVSESFDCTQRPVLHLSLDVGQYVFKTDIDNSKIKKSFTVAKNRDNSIYINHSLTITINTEYDSTKTVNF